MKKHFSLLMGVMLLLAIFTACSKDPYDQYIDTMEDFVEKVEKADVEAMTPAEALEFQMQFMGKQDEMKELERVVREEKLEPTPEQQKRIGELSEKMSGMMMKLVVLERKIRKL